MRTFLSSMSFIALLFVWQAASAGDADMATGISDEQLSGLGKRYAEAINDGNQAELDKLFDVGALGMRVARSITSDRKQQADYVKGFRRGASKLTSGIITQIQRASGRARFLGVRSFNGMRGPFVRYDMGDQGYNYVLLLSELADGGEPRIVDMFVATNGVRFSVTLGAVSQLMLQPSESILQSLFGSKGVDKNVLTIFREVGELYRAGNAAAAHTKLGQLPETMRNHRVVLNFAVQMASLVNEDLYRAELARLAKYFSDDPTAAFMLVDYYFYRKDLGAAMAALNGMERTFGQDTAIYLLKANIAMTDGKPAQAAQFASAGQKLEPDNEEIYWTLVTALMAAEDYKRGVHTLEMLEKRFGYEFAAENFANNEVYAGFVKSSEFASWTKGK